MNFTIMHGSTNIKSSNMRYVRHLSSSFPDSAIGSSFLDRSPRSRSCFRLSSARESNKVLTITRNTQARPLRTQSRKRHQVLAQGKDEDV